MKNSLPQTQVRNSTTMLGRAYKLLRNSGNPLTKVNSKGGLDVYFFSSSKKLMKQFYMITNTFLVNIKQPSLSKEVISGKSFSNVNKGGKSEVWKPWLNNIHSALGTSVDLTKQ